MTDADGLGDLVRRFRLDARLSQEALAERAGLSARAVSDIERGTSRPRAITLSLLEEALSLNASAREQIRSAGRAPGHEAAKTEPAWSEPERLVGRAAELARARAAIVEQRARPHNIRRWPGRRKDGARACRRPRGGRHIRADGAHRLGRRTRGGSHALASRPCRWRAPCAGRLRRARDRRTIDGRRVLFVLYVRARRGVGAVRR